MKGGARKGEFLSVKIRAKSKEIILHEGRPMTASEIEATIRAYEPKLWSEISKKCNDYIRIILSLSKGNIFPKYRSLHLIQGIDKRSIFFGVEGEYYDEAIWEMIPIKQEYSEEESEEESEVNLVQNIPEKIETKDKNIEVMAIHNISTTQPKPVKQEKITTVKEQPKIIESEFPIVFRRVDSETAGDSWNNLSQSLPMNDVTWTEITQAIYEIGEVYRSRKNPSFLLPTLYMKYKNLNKEQQRVDIENILMREMLIREELQNSVYAC